MKGNEIKVVIAGFILAALSTGLLINTIGQFILPITKDLLYSTGAISLAFSIILAGPIFASPFMAWFISRYGARTCIMASSAAVAVSAILFSFSSHLWQFYSLTLVMGVGFIGTSLFAISILMTERIPASRRGFGTSIALSGSGVGGMLFNPLFNNIIYVLDWRWGFRGVFLLYLAGGIAVYFLIGSKKEHAGEEGGITLELTGVSYEEAKRDKALWMTAAGFMLVSGAGTAVMMHAVPYFISVGIKPMRASLMMSFCLGVLAISKVVLGLVCDRFGIKVGLLGSTILFACCFILLFCMKFSWLFFFPFALFTGLGLAATTVPIPIMLQYLFGIKDFARILGAVYVIFGIGNTVLPALAGKMYDISGTFLWNWVVMAILSVLALLLFAASFRGKHRSPF